MCTTALFHSHLFGVAKQISMVFAICCLTVTGQGCGDDPAEETPEGQDTSVSDTNVSGTDPNGSGGESEQAEPGPCDPLDKGNIPITLDNIIGVGKDTSGVIYVVAESDAVSGTLAFISDGNTLYREHVAGSGEGKDPDGHDYALSLETAEGEAMTLIAHVDNEGNVAMGLVKDEEFDEGFLEHMGEDGELLEVLDQSAIADMTVQNLENIIRVEYYASVENGATILVTRPENDWEADEDTELFYGQGSELTERQITSFSRVDDGGSTYIDFKLDGQAAKIFFPYLGYQSDKEDTSNLEIGDETLAVTRHERDAFPAGDYTYICTGD